MILAWRPGRQQQWMNWLGRQQGLQGLLVHLDVQQISCKSSL